MLPLYLNRSRPLRVLRFIGHGAADQLGPVCAPADRERVAAALPEVLRDRDAARRRARWRQAQRGRGLVAASPARRVLLAEPSPTLAIDGQTWDEFLASKSKNFRDQVRRRERKLAKSNDLAFRLSDAEHLEEDLGTLTRLHAARWQDESAAFEPDLEAFHRDFAAVALERGWLRLWICEVDGRPVAAWYGLRYAGSRVLLPVGRDPDGTRSPWASSCWPTASAARSRTGCGSTASCAAGRLQGPVRRRRPGARDAVLGRDRSAGRAVAAAGRSAACPAGTGCSPARAAG